MHDSLLVGLSIVLLAGVFQASFMLPSKYMAGWAFENYWLIFAITAYLLCPWLFGIVTVPKIFQVYAGISAKSLVMAALFGTGWGLGALAFGLGINAIGLALGYAVILGVAATSGTLIPLFVHPPVDFTVYQGLVTAAALVLMLGGVVVCSFAGRWKEDADLGTRLGSYQRGVLICVASGLLSSCGNLGFAFGTEISERAQRLGTPEQLSGNALWTLLTFPLLLCNAGYAVYLLRRNGSAVYFRNVPSQPRRYFLAFTMGVMWMLGMGLYGVGARELGSLGPSFGWAILMSSMVLVSNAFGLLTGEWKLAPDRARRRLNLGIAILVLAICTLGYANHLQSH